VKITAPDGATATVHSEVDVVRGQETARGRRVVPPRFTG
jgi:hypothetical protein